MASSIASLLHKAVPGILAYKGLEKVNPKIKKFLGYAATAGYGVDESLNFLRSKFQSPGPESYKQQLEEGAAKGRLRPDEAASRQNIARSERIPKALGTAARIGGAALGGAAGLALEGASQLMPDQRNTGIQDTAPEINERPGMQKPSQLFGQQSRQQQAQVLKQAGQKQPQAAQPTPRSAQPINPQTAATQQSLVSKQPKGPLTPQQETVQKYNKMRQDRSVIEQLLADFEAEYGEGQMPQQPQRQGPATTALMEALQRYNQVRGK